MRELKQIQQAALQSDYAYRQTAYLTNNIGSRLTGSAQAQRAVEYVAAEMRKLGLEVRLQKLTVPHWVRGEEKGELTEFGGNGTRHNAEGSADCARRQHRDCARRFNGGSRCRQ